MNSLLFNPFTLKMIFLHTFYHSKDNSIAQSYLNYNQLVQKCHLYILLVYFSRYLPACFIFIHSIIDSWILEMQKTVKIQTQESLVFSMQFNQSHKLNHFDHQFRMLIFFSFNLFFKLNDSIFDNHFWILLLWYW